MQKQIFPVISIEKELPFYVIGVGIECWQFPIERPSGYQYPQIFVSRKGEGILTVNGKKLRLPENTAFYIPAGMPHSYRAAEKDWYVDWMCFSGYEALALIKKWGLTNFAKLGNPLADTMHEIMQKAYYELKGDKIYGSSVASGLLYTLMLELRQGVDSRFSQSLAATHTDSYSEVLRYIEDHYSEQIRLSDLAELAGITEQHLCRLFKTNLEMRPMEFITRVRIMHAKEMLMFSEKPISEISAESGFQDSSYFSVVFKKYEGMSPAEFRRAFASAM